MAEAKTKKSAKKAAKSGSLGEKTKEAKLKTSGATEYTPNANYTVGQIVYHEGWQDEGPVVEVGKTEDGVEKVIVDFEEIGLKHLVMNYDLKI